MNEKTIVFAGGCFWGCEAYFQQLQGVLTTEVGYGQGHTENPTYQAVCTDTTGYAEVVKLTYDADQIGLPTLIAHLFRFIDPTSLNRQGHDVGSQYRTGIYYTDPDDEAVIRAVLKEEQKNYRQPLVVECAAVTTYTSAETYHQHYLDKNPGGYCHVDLKLIRDSEKKHG